MKKKFAKKVTKKEKWNHFWRNVFLLVTMVLMVVYLAWRVLCTMPLDEGLPQMIFAILLWFAEACSCFTTFELFYRKFRNDGYELEVPQVSLAEYPHVDVFIATHNEPEDILFKTANACTFMDYPDKNKVHIYFCDDGNRPSVAKLARDLGIGYIGMEGNKEAKSGNLNNAMAQTNSPLIATFDADMIPQHTFLMKTVPYFFLESHIKNKKTGVWRRRKGKEEKKGLKIGLIQTPQSFYNPDLFQFNLYSEGTVPNEQDFFSREVNIMRNSSNACAYTGSNTVLLRQAMEDIGGFPTRTITEDFEVSVRMQKEKYITYATSEVQAAGLTTTDFRSMIKQRKRWARGVIQSLQNTWAIVSPKLTMAGRTTYLCSYLYWLSFFHRIIFILAPIMFTLFDFRVVDCTFEEIVIFWLPSYLLYNASFRFLSSSVRTQRWSQTIDTIFAPYLIICVFMESIGLRETKFKVTSKERTERSDFVYAIPHIILLVMSVLAIIRFVSGKYGMALLYSSVIIFWLCYNMISLIYAVFFMAGRKAHRKSERLAAKEKVEITYGSTTIYAVTEDLSDEGMQFVCDKPCYLPEDQELNIVIYSKLYRSEMKGKLVYVKERAGKWHYAATVEPVDFDNKRQYAQLIYDRDHSLPTTIDLWSTIPDDLLRNVRRRLAIAPPQRRKQPRIVLNRTITFLDGTTAYAHDYNFVYFALSQVEKPRHGHGLRLLALNDDVVLELEETERTASKEGSVLYRVVNSEALAHQGVDIRHLVEELCQGVAV